jgi:AcrR family transcriptional regulator
MSESSSPPTDVSVATRDRILDAAERLFAEKGFEGTSVRDLAAAAGVNLAAVNYHFGGKEALYRATGERLMNELRERRMKAIRAALDAPDATLESTLRAFAWQIFRPLDDKARARCFIQLGHREMAEPRLSADFCNEKVVDPIERALEEAIRRFEPRLSQDQARFAVYAFVGQLIHAVEMASWLGTLAEERSFGFPFAELADRVVAFTAAGIRGTAGGRA